MIEYAKIVGIILSLFTSIISIMDNRLQKRLKKNDSITAEAAFSFMPTNMFVNWRLKRICRSGAIQSSAPGMYYFDAEKYAANKKSRRLRRMPLVLLIVAIILAIIFIPNNL